MSNAARARRYSPIFAATVTPENVHPLTTAKGKDYTRLSATISRSGKPDERRVMLAFGKSNEAVRDLLIPGKPVELAIQMDGGSVKIIGLPRARPVVIDPSGVWDKQAANDGASLETMLVDLIAVLSHLDIDPSLHDEILRTMLTGQADRIVDGETEDEEMAQIYETSGHILFPLLDAGVDYGDAMRALVLIRQLPVGQRLDDLRTLREQESARELLIEG